MNNNLSDLLEKDLMAGVFYAIMGFIISSFYLLFIDFYSLKKL
jgi:hypothetical protein